MNSKAKPVTIVVAEDDPDDRLLIKEALEEVRIANQVDFVEDGQELLDYLRREGKYADLNGTFLPGLILLDLNMPVMDGRECLLEIRGDPALKRIPVVVLTSSDADEDIIRTYDLGVNSFIKKPVSFSGLVDIMQKTTDYWLHIVHLPNS